MCASADWKESSLFAGGSEMLLKTKVTLFAVGWLVLISAAHAYLFVFELGNALKEQGRGNTGGARCG